MSQVTDKRVYVNADAEDVKIVRNLPGGSTLYYGDSQVTVAGYEGSLAAGASTTLSQGKWFVSAGDSNLQVESVTEIPGLSAAIDTAINNAVTAHTADTTAVHGVADTSVLQTAAQVASTVAAHEADTTSVHGIADTSQLRTATQITNEIATHTADSTAVHGIADTSVLQTAAQVDSTVATHAADTTAVHGIADTSVLQTAVQVNATVATHTADTTAVHGITDTADLALKSHFPVNVKASPHNATGDGSTDDTAAFNSARDAAGANGALFVPAGTYRLGDWAPLSGQTITGHGKASQLKAKTSATFAVDLSGLHSTRLMNLLIDGNSKASGGVRMRGNGGNASYNHLFWNVETQNCDVNWDIQAGTPVEVDKNLWVGCYTHDGNTAFKFNGSNSQSQILISCPITSFQNYGIRILGGDIWFQGADILSIVGSPGYGIYLEGGSNIRHLKVEMCVFEGVKGSVIGNTGVWPEYGVEINRCALNADDGAGASTDPAVKLSGSSGRTWITNSRVDVGNVKVVGDDHWLWEQGVSYQSGAAFEDAATNTRRQHWDNNGFDLTQYDAVIRALITSSVPLTIDGKAAQTAPLLKLSRNGGLKSQINSSGAFVSDDAAQGVVLRDTQGTPHYWRVTVSNTGVLTTTDLGTTRPD